jgi:SagB-type dehydrogenase family enzyme
MLNLPSPIKEGGQPLWECVAKRRSIRNYAQEPLTQSELSQLLWATQGITGREGGYAFRAAPSAGALYPLETYVAVKNVEGVEPGLYRYVPEGHRLDLIGKGDFSNLLTRAGLRQRIIRDAALVFVWTAVPARSIQKYGERALRYIFTDAGHIAENLYLAATALGLGCCAVGAFSDSEANKALQVDGQEETAVYMSTIGKRGSDKQ